MTLDRRTTDLLLAAIIHGCENNSYQTFEMQ